MILYLFCSLQYNIYRQKPTKCFNYHAEETEIKLCGGAGRLATSLSGLQASAGAGLHGSIWPKFLQLVWYFKLNESQDFVGTSRNFECKIWNLDFKIELWWAQIQSDKMNCAVGCVNYFWEFHWCTCPSALFPAAKPCKEEFSEIFFHQTSLHSLFCHLVWKWCVIGNLKIIFWNSLQIFLLIVLAALGRSSASASWFHVVWSNHPNSWDRTRAHSI